MKERLGSGCEAGVKTQYESGHGTMGHSCEAHDGPPSLTFVAVLIFILDAIGVLQSPLPWKGNGSTRSQWGYTIVYEANVIAAALSASAVVMLIFGGTSPAGRSNTVILVLLSIAALSTMLALVSSVFFTWVQHARPLLHVSFVLGVVAVGISASYFYRPGR